MGDGLDTYVELMKIDAVITVVIVLVVLVVFIPFAVWDWVKREKALRDEARWSNEAEDD